MTLLLCTEAQGMVPKPHIEQVYHGYVVGRHRKLCGFMQMAVLPNPSQQPGM